MEELQIENGNFTRIINPLIENLIKIPFKGCELAVAIYIIRKTYGFNKLEDEISLTQFQKDLSRSRQTIVTALKNLQLIKVARLVKQGTSKKHSNLWKINKYYNTWELVNMARLVQRKRGTSLTKAPQLVKTARHTKDNTKDNITKYSNSAELNSINQIIDIFYKTINPNINYANKSNRDSTNWLIGKYGLEKIIAAAKYAVSVQGQQYAPTITTPTQLKNKMAELSIFKKKSNNSTTVII